MAREEIRENNTYYTIIGGSFRVQVDKDEPNAVRRDWTSADGARSGTKYERHVKALRGYIEDIQFRDGEYGMQVYVMLDENEDGSKPVIAMQTSSREAEDFLKKLPAINLLKEVRLRPFNFEGDSGDEVRGMEVLQEDEFGEFSVKIKNYFRDAEKKENINGYPSPEGDTESYSKDDWKLYFLTARKFLVGYTRDTMAPKVAQAVIDRGVGVPQSAEQEQRLNEGDKIEPPAVVKRQMTREELAARGEEEPNPDDIPF